MKYNEEFVNDYLKGIFKPGAVLVSYGMRGGGKTHAAVSFCQRLVENHYPGTPKHVIIVTNVIFVKKTEDGVTQETPEGVHFCMTMRDFFPIVADCLEKYPRKDLLIVLLLDEAQNFLLGDNNNQGDMAKNMKSFCGILRKTNTLLWLLTPALRNLGPAFRGFLDDPTDPANVTCTLQKNNLESEKFIKQRHYDLDPRDIVFMKTGYTEPRQRILVPTSSWTRDPEKIEVGEFVYDNLASADFTVGEGFPFSDFVNAISGKDSSRMVPSIRDFYRNLAVNGGEMVDEDYVRKIELAFAKKITPALLENKKSLTTSKLAELFGVRRETVSRWNGDVKTDD